MRINIRVGVSSSPKERIEWLDVSRGLAFMMVIYQHMIYFNETVMMYFTPVFLTTFFFVSGYLHKSGYSFSKVFEQRTRTLLWPLLFLGSILIIMQHILTMKSAPLSWTSGFKALIFQNGENTLLWFIAALYIYSLVFYWIERWSGSHLFCVSLCLFIANWIYEFVFNGPFLPWYINAFGYGCAYMGLGRCYKEYEKCIVEKVRLWHVIISLVLYILVITLLGHSCNFSGSKYLVDSLSLTLLGLFVMIELCKRYPLRNSKFLLFVGANTLFYFAFHNKAYSVLNVIVEKIFAFGLLDHNRLIDGLCGVIIMLATAVVLIPFAIFVNKFTPWALGKGFRLYKAN